VILTGGREESQKLILQTLKKPMKKKHHLRALADLPYLMKLMFSIGETFVTNKIQSVIATTFDTFWEAFENFRDLATSPGA